MSYAEEKFQRQYGKHSDAFKRGYKSWSVLEDRTNPYEPGTAEHKDFSDGRYWASFDYDWQKEKAR